MAAIGRRSADLLLVAELATGATRAEAAQLAGVSERTVRRRMKEPEFRREVELARQEMVDRAVGRGSNALVAAVDVHVELMHSSSSDTVRLNAARNLLSFLGGRRWDPVGEALHGESVPIAHLRTIAEDIFRTALLHVDDAAKPAFVRDIEKLGR